MKQIEEKCVKTLVQYDDVKILSVTTDEFGFLWSNTVDLLKLVLLALLGKKNSCVK